MKYIFHGTDAKLLDKGLVAGTFFTPELNIALQYGKTLYVIDHDAFHEAFNCNWEGHYVSSCFIPIEYLIILKKEL